MSDMSNGKTYTEVVAEFKTEIGDLRSEFRTEIGGLRVEFVDRINNNHVAVLDRFDDITSGQATAEARYSSQKEQVDDNKDDIKTNAANIVKVRNLNATLTAFFSGAAAWFGWNQ